VIEKLMALQIADYIPEAKLSVGTMETLATELRALLAERDRLAGEVADLKHSRNEWRDIANEYNAKLDKLTTPTPPRRLREYVSETTGARYCVDGGIVQFWDGGDRQWREPHAVNVKDVAAIADLIANPDEPQPVETLEDVVLDWWRNWDGTDTRNAPAALCTRLRSWLATQPQPNTTATTFAGIGTQYGSIGGTVVTTPEQMAADRESGKTTYTSETQKVETLEKVIGDAFRDCPNGGDVYEYAANAIRAHLATQPQTITPEQAVAVLVAHGARRSTAWNSVIATGGGNHAVLILPTATPEVTP
jgi:hypothetical protein